MEEDDIKVTYLFGAGASANALPVVSTIPISLQRFLEDILSKDIFKFSDENVQIQNHAITRNQLKHRLCDTLNWLIKETQEHASIDTFAKKLYLKGETNKLIALKAALSCFFTYLQTKNNFDKRYDTFFASILSDSSKPPNNLRILSWNYDSQFELAYNGFFGPDPFSTISLKLNITPHHQQLHMGERIEARTNEFAVFKLNGTAGALNTQKSFIVPIIDNIVEKMTGETADMLIQWYGNITLSPHIQPLMTFAWERTNIAWEVIERAMESTKNTEVLVCIGYSFPFFNRDIDRRIIGGMPDLKKIYFQALPEHINDNIARFSAIRSGIEKIPVDDVSQFFLPPEL